MLDTLLTGWGALINGAPWKRQRERHSITGYVRAVEVTYGSNGWHPHVHALLFLDEPISDQGMASFRDWISTRWADRAERLTGQRPDDEHGVDMRRVDDEGKVLSAYLSKVQEKASTWGVGAEMSRGDVKQGRSGGSTPFELLDADHPLPEGQRRALWLEWVAATKGRRCITWAKGLKERYEVLEVKDEDFLDDLVAAPAVLAVDRSLYMRLMWRAPGELARALEMVESGESPGKIANFLLGLSPG